MQPFDRALGLSPAPPSRSPEGAALRQGSGGVPQISFYGPLPLRKGAGGDGPSHERGEPPNCASPEDAAL